MSCSTARVLTTLLFTLAMGSSASAWADACAAGTSSFTDVPDAATFCTNTQWLKNRGVTIGCGAGTTFCPSDTVIRSSMALFMNRLGTALTPQFLTASRVLTGIPLNMTGRSDCATDDIAAVNYPRTGTVSAWVSLRNSNAATNVYAAPVISLDGGGYTTNSQYSIATLPDSTSAASLPADGSFNIPAGQTAHFAIFYFESSEPSGVTITVMTCSVVARIDNFNSATAPF